MAITLDKIYDKGMDTVDFLLSHPLMTVGGAVIAYLAYCKLRGITPRGFGDSSTGLTVATKEQEWLWNVWVQRVDGSEEQVATDTDYNYAVQMKKNLEAMADVKYASLKRGSKAI